MFELTDARIFMLDSRETLTISDKCVGFYIYRDMMGRTVIEDIHCDGEHEVHIAGNEATKPFMLILSAPETKKQDVVQDRGEIAKEPEKKDKYNTRKK